MDVTQAIHVMRGHDHGLSKLSNDLVNFHHIFDTTSSRIHFCYYRNTPVLMHLVIIEWEDGVTTSISLMDCDMYRVKYNDKFVKVGDIEVGDVARFSWDERKGTVIDKKMVIVSPCYIFTLSNTIEIDRILVSCKVPRLLKHTRLTSRISSKLVNPSLCLGMKHLL